jgi:D-alanyl-D-alanine carboxypeptidase
VRLAAVLSATAAAIVLAGCGGTAAAPPWARDGVRAIPSRNIPGAVLFVRDGSRRYTAVAGYADSAHRVPMRAGDTFRIGSITKSYTAALVMRLVAEGRIALDAPVSRYLPGLVPDGGRITIRELLSHTSGLFNFTEDDRFFAPYLAGHLRRVWTPRQLVALAVAHPPLFPPGARYSYSNTNFVLLGLVLERVGGATYCRQLRDHVIRPLGLGRTSLDGMPPDARGYYSRGGFFAGGSGPLDVTSMSQTLAWSAGGIVATGEEVADFYRALLSGRIVPSSLVAEMERTRATGGQYGLGLAPTQTPCGRAWGHAGNFPGYFVLAISSADGVRQAVLLVDADPTLIPDATISGMFRLLDRAYCGA